MCIFYKTNYIDNICIIKQVFQCTAKVILFAKVVDLWTFYENVVPAGFRADPSRN